MASIALTLRDKLPTSPSGTATPGYASTMSRSDDRISTARPCLLGLSGQTSGTALPSSGVIRLMTRCGPRPRHAATGSPINACRDTGFGAKQPLAQCESKISGLNDLHLRCG